MKKSFLLSFCVILYSYVSLATPPQHGWHAINDLDQVYSDGSSPVGLQKAHCELGEHEKELTQSLPDNSSDRNVLLVRFSLLVQHTSGKHRLIDIPLNKPKDLVFDSSAVTAFSVENFQADIGEAKKAETRLSARESSKLDELGIASIRVYNALKRNDFFTSTLLQKYTFFSHEFSIEEIIRFAQDIAKIPLIQERYPDFVQSLDKRVHELTEADRALKERLVAEKRKLDDLYLRLNDAYEHLDTQTEAIEASFRTMQKLSQEAVKHFVDFRKFYEEKMSPIVGEFWHSEPKLIHYLRTKLSTIELPTLEEDERPVFLFLNVHSRFDICRICGPSLLATLSTWGILADEISGHFGLSRERYSLVSSFRQFRPKLWDQAKVREFHEEAAQVPRIISLEELRTVYQGGTPYFFSAYIGDSSEIPS